jgi:hypothetical protein
VTETEERQHIGQDPENTEKNEIARSLVPVVLFLGAAFIVYALLGDMWKPKPKPDPLATDTTAADRGTPAKVEFGSITQPSYSLPPIGTKSLISEFRAERDSTGKVVVRGRALLPYGTRVDLDIYPLGSTRPVDILAEKSMTLGEGGSFAAGPFEIAPGTYKATLMAYFNGAWQTPSVLALVGKSGTKLPAATWRPDDPEFPETGGSLDYSKRIQLGPLPLRAEAIRRVKAAKLYVKGKGMAVDRVGEIVEFFNAPGWEFRAGEWSSREMTGGVWEVSLEHYWGKDLHIAKWEYNSRTHEIRYTNPEAKMFSWIPHCGTSEGRIGIGTLLPRNRRGFPEAA